MSWRIRALETSRGENLIGVFIDEQQQSTKAKIVRMISMLEKYGSNLGAPYSKKINRDLWELRISGKEAIRVFYTAKGAEIILLHIFKKKTQEIPKKEIKLARQRLRMF